MNAPVLVLGYNRPSHLQRALLALSSNTDSKFTDFYISIDGPRNISEAILIDECQKIASLDYGFRSTKHLFSEFNQGLAKTVITNVTNILENHGSIIVVEDDLVVSKHFLRYMNLGLQKYHTEKCVASIHGYQYPIGLLTKECVFLRGADCWGWATWKDRWDSAEFNVDILLKQININGIRKSFDLGGYQLNYKLLSKQKKGEVDSWAIRWHASMFVQNRLTLYPPESLVINTGLDGSGRHESINSIFDTELSNQSEWVFPMEIKESKVFIKLLKKYFKRFLHEKFYIRLFKYLIRSVIKKNEK
jgi:hypothetical protein